MSKRHRWDCSPSAWRPCICGANSTRDYGIQCNGPTSDGKPCPVPATRAPGLCWIHHLIEGGEP